jgi:hypothetical protein
MSQNYFTYSLSNNDAELSPKQFGKSLYLTIHFGNDEKGFTEKQTIQFPKTIKTATNKRQFVEEYLKLVDKRRLNTNEKARHRRLRSKQAKQRTISDEVSLKEETLPSKDLKIWALNKYFPTTAKSRIVKSFRINSVKLKNNMVYIEAEKEFFTGAERSDASIALKVSQSFIFFNEEINVTINDKQEEEKEKNQILNIVKPLIKPIFKKKGINKYIVKLYNIQYDNNNNIHLGVDNKYSLGWSMSRSAEMLESQELKSHVKKSLDFFYNEDKKSAKEYLSRKFLSKITTIGILVEKLVDII